jgi:translation initiation factor 1
MSDLMTRKNRRNEEPEDKVVFSTDPGFRLHGPVEPELETLPAEKQKIELRLDTKQRAGKAVTLVEGFIGSGRDLESLAKTLKTYCGTGGSVKEKVIVIQGDQREKLLGWLQKNGYRHSRRF